MYVKIIDCLWGVGLGMAVKNSPGKSNSKIVIKAISMHKTSECIYIQVNYT